MKRVFGKPVFLSCLAISLCGCNSIFGLNFARHGKAADMQAAARQTKQQSALNSAVADNKFTEQGRASLSAGQTGMAIEAFQKALGAGEPIAPAANGLAVGYANIGRADLAARFFQQALAADPENPMYAANLLHLNQELSDSMLQRAAAQVSRQAQDAARSKRPLDRGGSYVERVSRMEVRIVSARSASTNSDHPGMRRTLARIVFANGSSTKFEPAVRIVMPTARTRPKGL